MSIQLLDLTNTTIPIEFIQFSGGERHLNISAEYFSSLDQTLKIKANIYNSADLIDYLLLESVLLEKGIQIQVEIPYFPYARQDRYCAPGQAFSLNLMTQLLNINNASADQRKQITVWDAHSSVTHQLLNQNTQFESVVNISPDQIISSCPRLVEILSAENSVLICPDAGAIQRTQTISAALSQLRSHPLEIVYCEKKRDPSTGKILATQVNHNNLSGITAVITDDICDGGATFIAIAQQLRQLNCQRIVLYVTHGIFSRGLDIFDGLIDQIFCSASFPHTERENLTLIRFDSSRF